MFLKYVFHVAFYLLFHTILAEGTCEEKLTCTECIQDPNACVWCGANDFNDKRCRPQTIDNSWCPGDIENPESKAINASNKDFSSVLGKIIQVRPQSFKLNLRPGQSVDFDFSFKATSDFPVDFYFLLDASKSMQALQKDIMKQSDVIYETLRRMTKDVNLGLGTFIDKMTYPMANVFNPNETYTFKNHLNLTSDYETFKIKVGDIKFSENLDVPESGLDALAQVMACKEGDGVGWRVESTKIVVLMTDQPYHSTGDGRLAGLFDPYDGGCYTVDNVYTKELVMDYPSPSMINKLASDKDIIVIFFITEAVVYNEGVPRTVSYLPVYQKLSKLVTGSKALLYNEKGSNLVTELEKIYKDITAKVKLKVRGKKKNYEISFRPNCTSDNSGPECDVRTGQEQKFTVTTKLLQYDNYNNNNNELYIIVEGYSGRLNLSIEFIKNCDCEMRPEMNSDFCNGEPRVCGICKCINRYGERCACEKGKDNTFSDNSTCMAHKSDNILCSGNGACFCGACQCRPGYEGSACQCNKYGCKWNETSGLSCYGHGTCECGKCKCDTEWTGDVCQCPKSKTNCETKEGMVCNGRGECNCGVCKCHPIAKWDVRNEQDEKCQFVPCANMTNCQTLQCSILKECARCKLNESECIDLCSTGVVTTIKDDLQELNMSDWEICKDIRVKVGCYMQFAYRYNEKAYGVEIVVQKNLDCAENYLMYGGICFLTLLIVGIGTLVTWKTLTENHYRQEYKQFIERHRDELTNFENPLYQPTETSVKNPMFKRSFK